MNMLKSLIKIAMMLVVTSNVLLGQFSGGAGTQASPYLIKTKADLMNIRDSFAVDKHYKLCNNIRDSLREPIPYLENSVFDGQGYKITLAIKNHREMTGLFAEAFNSTLRNIVVDGYIISDALVSRFIGGIVGNTENTSVYNCVNLANITTDNACFAGIIGHCEYYETIKLENNINLGTIKYKENGIRTTAISGIIGHSFFRGNAAETKIKNNINAGFLTSDLVPDYYDYVISGIVGLETIWIKYNSIIKNINTGVTIAPYIKQKIKGIAYSDID